ncbi:hypothetical protein ACFQU2_24985 [Siccirubricoccus deserti]
MDASACLPATFAALAEAGAELVVVDGGSSDDTAAVARAAGARVVVAPRGRASSLPPGPRRRLATGCCSCMRTPARSPAGRPWCAASSPPPAALAAPAISASPSMIRRPRPAGWNAPSPGAAGCWRCPMAIRGC